MEIPERNHSLQYRAYRSPRQSSVFLYYNFLFFPPLHWYLHIPDKPDRTLRSYCPVPGFPGYFRSHTLLRQIQRSPPDQCHSPVLIIVFRNSFSQESIALIRCISVEGLCMSHFLHSSVKSLDDRRRQGLCHVPDPQADDFFIRICLLICCDLLCNIGETDSFPEASDNFR